MSENEVVKPAVRMSKTRTKRKDKPSDIKQAVAKTGDLAKAAGRPRRKWKAEVLQDAQDEIEMLRSRLASYVASGANPTVVSELQPPPPAMSWRLPKAPNLDFGLGEAAVAGDGGGLRYNSGKPLVELVDPDFILALAEHCTKAGGPVGGPTKYPHRNWERGMSWTKVYGCLQRHALAWMKNEDFDETSAHHMIAVAWNAMVLYAYFVRGHGTDDRPRYVKRGPPRPTSV